MSAFMVSLDHQMEFHIFVHTVTFGLRVCLVCSSTDRSIPLLLTTTFLKDPCWNHDKSTPCRSELNGIADHEVRKVKEGTSALLVQSGLHKGEKTPENYLFE